MIFPALCCDMLGYDLQFQHRLVEHDKTRATCISMATSCCGFIGPTVRHRLNRHDKTRHAWCFILLNFTGCGIVYINLIQPELNERPEIRKAFKRSQKSGCMLNYRMLAWFIGLPVRLSNLGMMVNQHYAMVLTYIAIPYVLSINTTVGVNHNKAVGAKYSSGTLYHARLPDAFAIPRRVNYHNINNA